MRIAVTNHHRKIVGGTESYLNRVIPELERAGHEVMLFHETAVCPSESLIQALRHSSDWFRLPGFGPDLIFNHGLQSPECEHALADLAPVVHFAHNYHGTCISGEKTRKFPHPAACPRRFGPACLTQYLPRNCGGWNPLVMVDDYRTQSGRLRAMLRARIVVTASRHMQEEYRHHGLADVRVAPLFVMQSPMPLGTQEAGVLRILFAGRMTLIKGAAILAEAARSIPSARVTFAGDGPERARVQRLLPSAAFPGWVSQAKLRELAALHDVLAMPSIWPEPFGLAGLELGLPVTAFAVGGIPEWLTDGENGALATPPTPEAFAAALERCARIPNARAQSQAAAARFTIAQHMQTLLPILEQACGF